MKNNYLVIGILKNWDIVFNTRNFIWGLKESFKKKFENIKKDDILWLYVTEPIKGIIGVAKVKGKEIDKQNLFWDEEKELGKVIWPLRFYFEIIDVIPRNRWKKECIKINDLNIFWQCGFQLLKNEYAEEIRCRWLKRRNIIYNF